MQLSLLLPVNQDRSTLVHSLCQSTGVLERSGVAVVEATGARAEELYDYHSKEYIAALAYSRRLSERQCQQFGLVDDCPVFPGLYEYAQLCAGGSLQAPAALCSSEATLAFHWDGGRHHAHKSTAAGFCYVNDVVLAILRLLGSFRRVMYVDLDVHHGDAVEEAFYLTRKVLTISLHKAGPLFFPGTGQMDRSGAGRGSGFNLNLPLKDGLRDELFTDIFKTLVAGAAQLYKPDCVVLQCGADGLAHDPLGNAFSLSPRSYAACAAEAASWGMPLLVLGGGGYNSTATACCWTAMTAAFLGQDLEDDIPEHPFFDRYGPMYQIYTVGKPALRPDLNQRDDVMRKCSALLKVLAGE
ncbi:hypothetical protein WJX72_010987 [[Myrmecia] bisecta]|uniref:histone deacetylase n=1 Tax=[Myrmecia] bisecta TaxID=41462 RepID=A0AAW1PI17_9CHLO